MAKRRPTRSTHGISQKFNQATNSKAALKKQADLIIANCSKTLINYEAMSTKKINGALNNCIERLKFVQQTFRDIIPGGSPKPLFASSSAKISEKKLHYVIKSRVKTSKLLFVHRAARQQTLVKVCKYVQQEYYAQRTLAFKEANDDLNRLRQNYESRGKSMSQDQRNIFAGEKKELETGFADVITRKDQIHVRAVELMIDFIAQKIKTIEKLMNDLITARTGKAEAKKLQDAKTKQLKKLPPTLHMLLREQTAYLIFL